MGAGERAGTIGPRTIILSITALALYYVTLT